MKKVKITFLFFVLLGTNFLSDAQISQIRWGSTGNPLNGLTITWSNGTSNTDSISWGYTTNFEQGHFGGTKRNGYDAGVYFFAYNFGTITPSATIYYKLFNSKNSTWGSQYTFATAPAESNNNYSITVLGDSRDDMPEFTTVSNLANAKKGSFTLFNGDLTADATASEFDQWFAASTPFLQDNLIYHAVGNHELGNVALYSNCFDLPTVSGSNLHYSTRYGNTILITFDSNNAGDATQLSWLTSALAAAAADTSIKWKIISFHIPFFNTGNHTGDMDAYRSTVWKVFDNYGVDLVLNGHDHNFQRSKPINLNVSPTAPVSQYGSGPTQGRCEIITGGAGAPLYTENPSSSDAWAINKFSSVYNYTYIQVNGCVMNIKVYDDGNNVLGTFSLNKSSACATTIGINELQEKFYPITVFPNPSKGTFIIKYSSPQTGETTITVCDMAGKQVAVEKANKTSENFNYTFNLSKYSTAKGIYNVSLKTGSQVDNAILKVN